jgi:hypothetical protein
MVEETERIEPGERTQGRRERRRVAPGPDRTVVLLLRAECREQRARVLAAQ